MSPSEPNDGFCFLDEPDCSGSAEDIIGLCNLSTVLPSLQ